VDGALEVFFGLELPAEADELVFETAEDLEEAAWPGLELKPE